MRIAIIGLGVIGKLHYSVLNSLGETVCALCDIDERKTEEYHGIPKYKDYVKMLDEIKPDAVHICTPHYLHAEMIIEALSRDINVLAEKPLCIKHEDIARILEAESRSKAKLGVCLQNRYNSTSRFVKDYLKDKEPLSAFGSVVWCRDKEYYESAQWRGKWSTEGGGVMINQAIHTLDLVAWLLGMPTEVVAACQNLTHGGQIEVEDTAFAVFSGSSNFSFAATSSHVNFLPVEITVKTKEELIKMTPEWVAVNGSVTEFREMQKFDTKACYGNGHSLLISDFYSCLREGRPFPIDGAEAAKSLRLVLSMYKSCGKRIEILK